MPSNTYLVVAASIAILVGLVHSTLGEKIIFRRLRKGSFIPAHGGNLLHEKHIRIIWASWHALTIFGWCFAALLFYLAGPTTLASLKFFVSEAIIAAMVFGSLLVFVGTRAKHPGWIGLLAVAAFTWLGMTSNP